MAFSTTARRDLRRIHRYIAEHNPTAADRFVLALHERLVHLAELGMTGVSREQLGEGLRAFGYRHRVIYFRLTDSHLYIVRILHGRQDLSPDDFPESDT